MAENTPTPNYNFNLPLVGGDDDVWGDLLNANWSSIDTILWTVSGVASAALTPVTGDARYLRLTGGTLGPNSLIVNGPASLTNYTQVTGQFASSGGATFGTGQVFFNSQVTFSADALMVTPAPTDNSQRAATTNWVNAAIAAAAGGEVPEAPNDGTAYARKSQAWSHLAHTDITDWTASLAPYALTTSVPVAATALPLMNGTAAVGASALYSRGDHVHPSDTSRLATSGGTLTGALTLAADPTAALQPATKQYVDGGRYGDNRIVNGDMRVNQRGVGSGTANGYTVDRWQYSTNQAGKITWAQGTTGPAASGFPYFVSCASSSAYTPAATDSFSYQQAIEADMVGDLEWGTPNAQPVTLSFWAASTVSGTFSGSLCSGSSPFRSYPFTFPVTGTWTKFVVNIPGDTSGTTWALTGNGAGMYLRFDLGCGSNFRAPANAWATGNFIGANGAVSIVSTNGAAFYLTGVKLEIGSTATPFNRQSLAKSMADCQRYFWVAGANISVASYFASAGGNHFQQIYFPVAMRSQPTLAYNINSPGNLSANGFQNYGATKVEFYATTAAAGVASCIIAGLTANAEL